MPVYRNENKMREEQKNCSFFFVKEIDAKKFQKKKGEKSGGKREVIEKRAPLASFKWRTLIMLRAKTLRYAKKQNHC